jgi:UDP-N-acetylmuramoyl-tripeptide--D-alanyl-D-alanine ligase
LFHFAQFLLPLADLINWPIEEAFRQYYLLMARAYLDRSGATVIAITGSYGKTSTKHYLQHILEGKFRSLMTPKSYNTLLGISRVINDVLSKDVSYDYFIVETDAYFVGENARICKLVRPKLGMIMTVGPMHLERLGSMENIAKAQYEVIQALPPGGAGFFNGDDPLVREMADRGYPQTRVVVSQHGVPGANLEALNIRMSAEGLDFDLRDNSSGEGHTVHAPLYGDHNVTNILMAAAVAHHLGMTLAEIGMRVATLQPAEHRLIRRALPDGTVIIDDTYSANPVGTQTALGVLGLHRDSAHRIVVSSGMFELGSLSDEENRKLGERMSEVATDVILIGADQTKPVKQGLEACRFPPDHVHVVNTLNEATTIYKDILRPGDTLLMLTDLPDLYA